MPENASSGAIDLLDSWSRLAINVVYQGSHVEHLTVNQIYTVLIALRLDLLSLMHLNQIKLDSAATVIAFMFTIEFLETAKPCQVYKPYRDTPCGLAGTKHQDHIL